MAFNLKIRKADVSRSTFNLSFPHLTSAEFLQNNVIMSKFCVPSDHFKISPSFEARCASLVNPAFVDTKFFVRAFYVPHSVVWSRFDDWVTANPTYISGTLNSSDIPHINDIQLTRIFVEDSSFATKHGTIAGLNATAYNTLQIYESIGYH